ncbi:uncharacterized protein LOC121784612 [Salvia splendens]|uniref:uncharacterized protein LOC121784612 n=1 Tax=Salvia splendens TaxID=180675 RepID=UPI001C26172A|nr:uncharacterized protein LOC121784612 [Salvia splendens]
MHKFLKFRANSAMAFRMYLIFSHCCTYRLSPCIWTSRIKFHAIVIIGSYKALKFYLFESRNDVVSMPCGHTIHRTCLEQMQDYYRYACPICSKSVRKMSKVWEKYDLEIAATPMLPYYEDKMVSNSLPLAHTDTVKLHIQL